MKIIDFFVFYLLKEYNMELFSLNQTFLNNFKENYLHHFIYNQLNKDQASIMHKSIISKYATIIVAIEKDEYYIKNINKLKEYLNYFIQQIIRNYLDTIYNYK
jgi:hypothetical protein